MSERISRRELIGGAAAGAATAALPTPGAAAASRRVFTDSVDVVVVGAGLAGLAAARRLRRAGQDVLVLEARSRVGGRIQNRSIGGDEVVEVGGQWIGPTQDHLLALSKAVGVKRFKTYDKGEYVDYRNDLHYTYPKETRIPPGDPVAAADAAQAIVRLNEMANTVPRRRPWKADDAQEFDSKSFHDWMEENVPSPNGRELVSLGIEAVFSAQPRDMSLLHVLFYIHSAGSLDILITTGGGAQDSRFVGGSQLVAKRAANRLGDRVRLNSPVRKIKQTRSDVVVSGPGFRVRARRVIVAIPPTLSGRIEYEPALPGYRDQLLQRLPMGTVIKVQCLYDEPFWRAEGLAGQATSDTGPVKITFDNSPPDGKPGVLMGFIEGEMGRDWGRRSKKDRREGVIDSFARYFGPKARRVEGYIEKNWAREEWTRGCYGAFWPTGVWTSYGPALRRRVGRIHWAGTELASRWSGYMDGAIRSGKDAAEEVLRKL